MSDRLPHEQPDHPTPIDVGKIDRGPDDEIRVGIIEGPGQPKVDARLWYRGTDDQFGPTRKGLRLSLREAAELASLLDIAISRAEERRARRTRGGDGG